jgi:uncharacterized membrane protein
VREHQPDPAHRIVALVLQGGFVIGGCLLALGVVLGLVTGDASAPALRLGDLLRDSAPLHSRVEMVGVAIFATTPAVGVLALLAVWLKGRDWRAMGIAITVLIILSAGMILGHG